MAVTREEAGLPAAVKRPRKKAGEGGRAYGKPTLRRELARYVTDEKLTSDVTLRDLFDALDKTILKEAIGGQDPLPWNVGRV